MKITICLLLTFVTVNAVSQNILTSTIEWKSVSTLDANNGDVAEENGTILSSPNSIQWLSSTGAVKYEFTIQEANGSWSNISHAGEITYKVSSSGRAGVVSFKRGADNRILVRVVLSNDETPVFFELTISEAATL